MNLDNLFQTVKDFFNQFIENFEIYLPVILNSVLLIVLGFIIAWIVKSILLRLSKRLDNIKFGGNFSGILSRIQFGRSVEKIITAVYWFIVIIFITLASEVLGLPIITTWLSGLVKYFPNLLIAIFLITSGITGGKILKDLISSYQITESLVYRNFLAQFIQYSIVAVSLLLAVDQLNIDITLLTTLIDIILAGLLLGASLAFGFGAKTSVGNILASYYLQNTYKVGHYIKIENIEGRIIQIKPNAVLLETTEGQISVPSQKFSELVSTLVKKD